MKLRIVVAMLALYGIGANPVHAASLSGTLGIDQGVVVEVPKLDANGDPVLDATGAPVMQREYMGGSYFSMGADKPTGGALLGSGSAGGITLGTHQPFILNPNEPHPDGHPDAPYGAGSGYASTPDQVSSMLAPFTFFRSLTYVGTNPVAYQSGEAHAAPTADVDMNNCTGTVCALTADLSSWEVMWNGSAFEQGPRPDNTGPFVLAVGTLDLANNFYTLNWASQIKNGTFDGIPGYWHLEGTLTPVPLPGALWLLASGLLGLTAVRRRARKME